jgi:basic membrane protein A
MLGVATAITSLLLAACSSNGATVSDTTAPAGGNSAGGGSSTSAAADTGVPTTSSNKNAGTILPGEPDTNGDGKVIIGVLSPGDIHDHGYYESFVDAANSYAKKQGWQVIERGSVPANDALNAARALCQQHVDMVALGAGELADAIPASTEPVCAKTAWYVPSAENIKQTPQIMLSSDDPTQDLLAAGYAAGILMKDKNQSKAGFVTGPKADFSLAGAKAYAAGIRELVPHASVIDTYTGDFNDSAKAKEATQAQISQGVKMLYPYLGGATDASALLANQNNVGTLTPGTDRCDSTSPKFDISVIFDPGDYFLAALQLFKAGQLRMGIAKVWQMGVDPYPTVILCNGTAAQKKQLADFIHKIGTKQINAEAEVKRLGS